MPKRKSNPKAMSVTIDGLDKAERVPGWLEAGQRRQLELATHRLADEVRRIGGRHLHGHIHDRVVTLTTAEITGDKIARAAQTGAYIRSRRGPGTAIRFQVGGQTRFIRPPKGARLPARKIFDKGLRSRKKVIQQAFDEVFGDLEHSVGGAG